MGIFELLSNMHENTSVSNEYFNRLAFTVIRRLSNILIYFDTDQKAWLIRAPPDEVGGGPIVIALSVRLSVRPSVCLSVRLSVCPS